MDCIRQRVNNRWEGLAINLKYANCPSCNQWIDAPNHNWIHALIHNAKELERKIKEKCILRAKHEGMDYDERLKDPKSEYFENLEKFAFDHLNYYECYECKEPYFGGRKQCGEPQPAVPEENKGQDEAANEEEKAVRE